MKKNLFFAFVLVVLMAFVAASCTSFLVSGVEFSQQPSPGDILGQFDIDVKVTKLLGGSAGINLFNLTSDASDNAINGAIRSEILKYGGSKAINVRIEYKATFINLLLNYLTSSIYAPATAHITGTVVR